jgi:ABC-2 type transport system ATP-binding protein
MTPWQPQRNKTLRMINVDKLVFEYPGLRALDNVSFAIRQGSITALVGPNGAGKTTLLRCLAGLEQPVSGQIHVDGVDVLQEPRACHRKIGYLSDFFGLYQNLSLRQCLYYVARAQGIHPADCPAAIQDVSVRLHLQDRLEMRPPELSRGLRQRLAIAQAIIHRPKVVLLDEPASGLDPEARHQLERLFLDLQQAGMTLLVSSHILAELDAYCSDMLVIRAGRIVEQVSIKTSAQTLTFKLRLAAPFPGLQALLASQQNLQIVKLESQQQALIEIPENPQLQHGVLQELLEKGLPICEFSANAGNLQDAYLETLGQHK